MKKYLAPLLLAVAFFLIGLNTLPDYGINWDAPFRMIRGQVYLDQILKTRSPKKDLSPTIIKPGEYASRFDFLDGEAEQLVNLPPRPLSQSSAKESFYRDSNFESYFMDKIEGHPPLIDILAAYSNRILWSWAGLLGDIASYQIVYLLFSSIGVFIVSLFAYEITGSYLVGSVSGLALFLQPLFFSEAHFNMKDPIQASFFAGSIWAFWHWVKSGKLGWFGVFFGFVALALATKWNIVFLPFILIPWLFSIRKSKEFKAWFKLERLGKLGVLGCLGVVLFLILIWPAAWRDPFNALLSLLKYYGELGTRLDPMQPKGFILPLGFNSYPSLLLFFQTPELILILTFVALVGILKKRLAQDLKIGYLLILWLFIPIIRISLPHVWFYNGTRQIMEVMPTLAILAGLGAGYLINRIKNQELRIKLLRPVFLILIALFLLIPVIRLHPNENVYFNNLVGGLKGADQKNLLDKKITYGNVLKLAANWLNANAPPNSNIAHLDGPMFALSPLLLRSDISISSFHFSGFDQKGEYILSLYDPEDVAVFAQRYPRKMLNPVHRISVDGLTILNVYQNSSNYVKAQYRKKEERTEQFTLRYLQIDLGKQVSVTRLRIKNILPTCLKTFTQFIDEFVEFDSGAKYALQERRKIDSFEIELSFPAEFTRYIRIYPQDRSSCFISGTISSISYYSD